jgi:hypothetical protein
MDHRSHPEVEFLDEIQTIFLRVFLLAIQSNLCRFALRFIFLKLTQPLTASTVQLLFTVKEKGGKTDKKKSYSLPYGLRNPYRNLKSEKISRFRQETSPKLYVHEFGFFTCRLVPRICYCGMSPGICGLAICGI